MPELIDVKNYQEFKIPIIGSDSGWSESTYRIIRANWDGVTVERLSDNIRTNLFPFITVKILREICLKKLKRQQRERKS